MVTQSTMKYLKRNWKKGYINWFEITDKASDELCRLGIIKFSQNENHFVINREIFNELMKDNQKTLTEVTND